MTTITNSAIVETSQRSGYTRYRYRYTLSTGGAVEAIGWLPDGADEIADMAARGNALLEQIAEREAEEILNG